MNRRTFLEGMTAGLTIGADLPASATVAASTSGREWEEELISGHTLIGSFHLRESEWRVYEDLRSRDGAITFISSAGKRRVLTKSAEPVFAQLNPAYLGLKLSDIGLSGPDLLANKLLERGEPDPDAVRSAAPPLGSMSVANRPGFRPSWNTFVGTKECFDTMPVYPAGNTRTYHPVQCFPDITQALAEKRFEGLLGGWMPAVRKMLPISDSSYYELLIFGDVEAHDKFIVQTWHRSAHIENGAIKRVIYGYSYPAFPPARQDPAAAEFYRALLVFAEYWDRQLHDAIQVSLPENVWVDISKHAFAKELMVRPGGVYPKYGAVDRDYYGSEYDGFQDIFTSAVYANLEWGRFEQAKLTIDKYFTDFVDSRGAINMRGPETAQFGLTLSLLAKYWNYTGDTGLLLKHRSKVVATAGLLIAMHDESLRLPEDDAGHGLIHGWSESDACLAPQPATWWQPYFANSAFAARGLRDIARVWEKLRLPRADEVSGKQAHEWMSRSKALEQTVIASVRKSVRSEMDPPYIGPLPGSKLTFRESMASEHPSPQQWPHRPYCELLQADILPPDLANLVIDCMRAYGATTLGVVANVSRPRANGRDILGFISYGYAQALLRLDRIDEYLLFLYSHRFHDHTPGSWTAGEVAGITGGTALFCIPAQQTVPLLVRWALVSEDSDEERLHLCQAVPRRWVGLGQEIRVQQAPTRWGRISFTSGVDISSRRVTAVIELADSRAPMFLDMRFRLPSGQRLETATVNGKIAKLDPARETVQFSPGHERRFEIVGRLS